MNGEMIRVPRRYRALSDVPDEVLQIVSTWPMQYGRLGVWLGRPGEKIGRRWPVTRVAPEQLEAWKVEQATTNDGEREGAGR